MQEKISIASTMFALRGVSTMSEDAKKIAQIKQIYVYNRFIVFLGMLLNFAVVLGIIAILFVVYMPSYGSNIAVGIVVFVCAILYAAILGPLILFNLYSSLGLIKKR
jgi:hypothetical protein